MSNDVLWNDDEKVQLIKNWWKKNGTWATTAIVVVLLAIAGWQYWQRHQAAQAEQASMAYEQLLTSEQQQPQATQDLAKQLKKDYSGSPYADYAAFTLAKAAVDKSNLAEAEQQLQWVIDHSKTDVNTQLARIRLARVFIADKKPQQAINTLNEKRLTIYPGLSQMVKGDAYVALNKIDLARTAYQNASKAINKQAGLWHIVQMKLNDLPAATEQK